LVRDVVIAKQEHTEAQRSGTALEDRILQSIQPKDAGVMAVEMLTIIKTGGQGESGFTDVEVKTELSEDEILAHTKLTEIGRLLNMTEKDFENADIISMVVERKERKSISKSREGRKEIVQVARPNEDGMLGRKDRGFIQRLFTPRSGGNA
jgi:hypothetical protein